MYTENLHRVFFHEIGHYVARELNFEYFQIGNGVEKIFIKTHKINPNYIEYEGGTIPIKPKDWDGRPTISSIPEHLGVLIYGCLFQTLFMKAIYFEYDFLDCFNLENNANGRCDCVEFLAVLTSISNTCGKDLISYTKKEYLNKLLCDNSHLKELFQLSPKDYLYEINGELIVNLVLLRNDLNGFMNYHKNYYTEFINANQGLNFNIKKMFKPLKINKITV